MAGQEDPESSPKPFPVAELAFYVIGTVIAAPLGKVGFDALNSGDYVRGGISLAAGLITAAVAFSFRYWESHLAEPTRRVIRELVPHKSIVAVGLLVIFTYAFVVIPRLFPSEPSLGAQKEISTLQSQLEDARKQISSLQSQLQNASSEVSSLKTALKEAGLKPAVQIDKEESNLTRDDIEAKIDIWRSVGAQMNDLAAALNLGYALIDKWPDRMKWDQRHAFYVDAQKFRQELILTVQRLTGLRDAYPRYLDVASALDPTKYDTLFRTIEGFLNAINKAPEKEYESGVRPYAGALKRDLDAVAMWQSSLRDLSARKGKELANAVPN